MVDIKLGIDRQLDSFRAARREIEASVLPLATSVVNIIGTAALLILLRRRLGRLEVHETGRATALVVIASGAFAGVAYGVWRLVDEAAGRAFGGQVASLGSAFLAGFAIYLISCRLLGVRELQALLSLRTRLRRG